MHTGHSHYDPSFVLLSIVVATLSAFVALDIIRSVTRATGLMRAVWYICGAIAMGTGIWSMHFIGMLAHHTPGLAISYDVFLMALSIVVAIATSGFALYVLSSKKISKNRIVIGAIAMTFGIGGMHYLGMVSMRMQALIQWNYWLVAASFGIALVLSFFSFVRMFRVPVRARTFGVQAISAILLGAAITGLHYVGMEAATYLPLAAAVDHSGAVIASSSLVWLTIFSTFFILSLALISALVERAFATQEMKEREHVAAVREAQLSSELKTQFLATMSHEIRTPLSSIIGFADLLLQKSKSPQAENDKQLYLETIRRCAGALSHLIDDILDLSKIELGHLELEYRPVDLNVLLNDVLMILQIKAEAKGIELRSSLGRGVPLYVVTDAARLRQILVNLIGNAIKFTDKGYVSLAVTLQNDKTLCFEVKDTGIGINPKKFDSIFQPFSQADSSMSRLYGGTGLGLDISRRLATALGGDVELFDSKPGVGSTFLVTLPLKVAEAPMKPSPAPANDLANLENRTVLLVDDNRDNQVFIMHLLRSNSVRVEVANNGREGVDKALAGEYDVILMDIQMPVLNGYEATRILREKGVRTPILALTAHATREDRERCTEAGCDGYLTKPVDTQALLDAVAGSPRKRSETRSAAPAAPEQSPSL